MNLRNERLNVPDGLNDMEKFCFHLWKNKTVVYIPSQDTSYKAQDLTQYESTCLLIVSFIPMGVPY